MPIRSYNPRQFALAEIVADILNVRRLDQVHTLCPAPKEQYAPGADQQTPIHHAFYSRMEELLPMYRAFVREVITPYVKGDGDLVYQAKPSFRVHLPGNVAVGAHHKDSEYGHQPREMNFWVPLTAAFGANTIWIESEPDKGDFAPVNVDVGQVFEFEGSKYTHGNVKNTLALSRVSFDLRCLRMSRYDPDCGGASHNTGKRFVIGGYYARMGGV